MATVIRQARREDVPAIVAMLADDPLGAQREQEGDPAYLAAFDALDSDPRQLLVVADLEDAAVGAAVVGAAVVGAVVVGTLQLTFLPGLSRRGATRAQIEAVRVRADQRGSGLGGTLVRWAVDTAREQGCALVQLTTDASRVDAHRFYQRLGFHASHVGMKLALT
jgi:GNAT superfamily N-acetyltransferase